MNGLRAPNYPLDMSSLTLTHHEDGEDDEGVDSQKKDVKQDYLDIEYEYEVVFYP